MQASIETKKAFYAKQAEIKALVDAEQAVPAEMVAELKQLKDLYDSQVATERAAKNKFIMEEKQMDKKLFNKAFKALLKGDTQTYFDTVGTGQVEVTDNKGGYLVDSELLPLDEYGQIVAVPARVIPVWAPKGNMPMIDLTQATNGNFLQSFDEIDSMAQTSATFKNVSYQCTERGAIVPVANRLLDDAAADVVAVVGEVFCVAAVADKNAKVLAAINAITNLATKYTGANKTFADKEGIKEIRKAILGLSGANRSKATVVVCDTTFAKLAQIEDSVGHPYLCQDVTNPSIYRIEGVPVVAIDDCFMTASNTLTEAAYVGNFERVASFERQGIEITTDTSNMFDKDAVAVKGKIYNCVKVLEDGAFVKVLTGAAPQ